MRWMNSKGSNCRVEHSKGENLSKFNSWHEDTRHIRFWKCMFWLSTNGESRGYVNTVILLDACLVSIIRYSQRWIVILTAFVTVVKMVKIRLGDKWLLLQTLTLLCFFYTYTDFAMTDLYWHFIIIYNTICCCHWHWWFKCNTYLLHFLPEVNDHASWRRASKRNSSQALKAYSKLFWRFRWRIFLHFCYTVDCWCHCCSIGCITLYQDKGCWTHWLNKGDCKPSIVTCLYICYEALKLYVVFF